MKILLLANFTQLPGEPGNNRFKYLAEELAKDHDVHVVTSDFSHGDKTRRSLEKLPQTDYQITLCHEPGYLQNISLKRFYSHYIFGKNVGKWLNTNERPDVIYCAIPSLTAACAAAKYCRKNGIRFVVDVQDLWPEAFQMVFRVPVISDMIFAPFRYLANKCYSHADAILGVSQTYVDRALAVNKKCKRVSVVFLGTALEEFDKNAAGNPVLRESDTPLWLGYCGTLGSSYDLTCVFDALGLIKARGEQPPKFIVMGDGPRKQEFENYAADRELDVVFTGKLSYPAMCGMLCACDMAVNPITRGAAQSIINKHADYAAAGLPVLSTQESREYRDLVETYNMGFNCENNDPEDLAQKIMLLSADRQLRLEMGKNARHCAEECFDRKQTYRVVAALLEEKETIQV